MEITIPFARLKEYQRKNGFQVKRTETLTVDIFIKNITPVGNFPREFFVCIVKSVDN